MIVGPLFRILWYHLFVHHINKTHSMFDMALFLYLVVHLIIEGLFERSELIVVVTLSLFFVQNISERR